MAAEINVRFTFRRSSLPHRSIVDHFQKSRDSFPDARHSSKVTHNLMIKSAIASFLLPRKRIDRFMPIAEKDSGGDRGIQNDLVKPNHYNIVVPIYLKKSLTWKAVAISGCVIVVIIFVIIVIQNRMNLSQRTGLYLYESRRFIVIGIHIIIIDRRTTIRI